MGEWQSNGIFKVFVLTFDLGWLFGPFTWDCCLQAKFLRRRMYVYRMIADLSPHLERKIRKNKFRLLYYALPSFNLQYCTIHAFIHNKLAGNVTTLPYLGICPSTHHLCLCLDKTHLFISTVAGSQDGCHSAWRLLYQDLFRPEPSLQYVH